MVNFPSSFDDDTTLFVAVNNLRTRLTAGITAGDTTIPVLTTSGYPDSGYISILTGGDITKTEAIYYPATTSTTFSGVTRGAGGTTAYPHNINDNVDLTIVADHHNELKNAVINLEHFVGVSGAENFLPLDDAGNVVVPGDLGVGGALSVQDSVVVSGGATFYFATITGSLTVGGDVTAVGTISGSEVKAPAAEFDTLVVNQESTVSGTPVMTSLPDVISITTLDAANVYASTSMTISGEPVVAGAASSSFSLTIKETDGSPTVSDVDTIVVTTGTLTDDGGGQVTLQIGGGGVSPLTVRESDGSPSVANVDTIVVSNSTLTDDGGGQVTIQTGGAGGGGTGTTLSGVTLDVDATPEYPTVFDDEFATSFSGTVAAGKWSVWDVDGQGFYGYNIWGNRLGLKVPGGLSSYWAGIYQDAPDGANDYNIDIKAGMPSNENLDADIHLGILFADDLVSSPSTSDFVALTIRNESSATPDNIVASCHTHTDYTDVAGTLVGSEFTFDYHHTLYLRLLWDSSNTRVFAHASTDGINWRTTGVSASLGYTPSHVGLLVQNTRGASTAIGGTVDYFRAITVDNPDVDLGTFSAREHPVMGRLIQVVNSGTTSVGGIAEGFTVASGSFTSSLNLPQYPSDPTSPTDGDVWINTTTSGIRWQVNSIVFEIQGSEV